MHLIFQKTRFVFEIQFSSEKLTLVLGTYIWLLFCFNLKCGHAFTEKYVENKIKLLCIFFIYGKKTEIFIFLLT